MFPSLCKNNLKVDVFHRFLRMCPSVCNSWNFFSLDIFFTVGQQVSAGCWLTRTRLWPAANVNVLHNAHTPTPAHSTLQHYARGIMIIYTYTQPSWTSCVLSHGEGQHGLGYFHFTILFANNQNNLQKEKLSSQPQTYLRINIITKAAIILFS